MTINTFSRLATSSSYANALDQLAGRQRELSSLQENLTAAKRIVRSSDDPAAAAQAERARTQMARVTTDQRALEVQRTQLSTGESTLGDAGTLMQNLRELIVKAGSSTYTAADRATMAQQMTSIRDQLLQLANAKDTNGKPLFGGLGSSTTPFVDSVGGVTYDGLAGQAASTAVAVPGTADGFATWMNVPTGNGVFTVSQATGTSNVYSDQGQVTNPSALTGHNYSVNFAVVGGVTTYSVVDNTTSTTLQTGQPYTAGQTIAFDGLSLIAKGTPTNGESLTIANSTRDSVFGTIDRAIASVKNGTSLAGNLTQDISRSLTEVDTAMARLSSARGLAGELLNRMDTITDAQGQKSINLESDRSRAEDLDMIKGYSDFQNQQTAYSAALQSYAKIQQLSLFNFLG